MPWGALPPGVTVWEGWQGTVLLISSTSGFKWGLFSFSRLSFLVLGIEGRGALPVSHILSPFYLLFI